MCQRKGLKEPEWVIFYEAAANSVKNGKHQVNTENDIFSISLYSIVNIEYLSQTFIAIRILLKQLFIIPLQIIVIIIN